MIELVSAFIDAHPIATFVLLGAGLSEIPFTTFVATMTYFILS